MLSCSFQNGPKEGRKEGEKARKKGLRQQELDWPYPYPLEGAQGRRAKEGLRISPSKTGHEEGQARKGRRTCHYWPLQRSIKELSEKDR